MERTEVLKLGAVAGKSLLDVGAGPMALIAARDFGCEVTTVDISTSALEMGHREAADAHLADRIKFDRQDATDLPYPDQSFDVAVSYGAVHHVPVARRQKLLAELFRVVRERIIVAEYTSAEFNRVHPDGSYELVALDWLEQALGRLGKRETHRGEQMNVCICHREKR
jgi:ubiquinone/menaquinone biosynthesis C-methylase UbiE